MELASFTAVPPLLVAVSPGTQLPFFPATRISLSTVVPVRAYLYFVWPKYHPIYLRYLQFPANRLDLLRNLHVLCVNLCLDGLVHDLDLSLPLSLLSSHPSPLPNFMTITPHFTP